MFFGASVTKQKTGYAYILKRLFEKDNYNTHIFGFGGMHLNNAGICMIDQIISKNPKYCFIDLFVGFFFSKGYCTVQIDDCTNRDIRQSVIPLTEQIYRFSKFRKIS